jgi:hypothetical protein
LGKELVLGLSQQIGASSLIKPGVIDNTAARPASPYEGQVIFQKDTDQLLVWNGTAWVIPNSPAQNPTGLELVTPTSVTNGTVTTGQGTVRVAGTAGTVTINGVFSSSYESYLMVCRLSWASGAGDATVQLCIAGTPTGGTAYNWSMMQAYACLLYTSDAADDIL